MRFRKKTRCGAERLDVSLWQAGTTFGTLEVWFALHFIGWPVTVEQAVILESLGASISIAGFLIPASLGVQEAGYVVIGQLLGLPIQFSLSLSLASEFQTCC